MRTKPQVHEDGRMRTDVAATLTMTSPEPATALLQIAVADPGTEQLTVLSGDSPVEPEEFEVNGARVHRLRLLEGDTTVNRRLVYTSGASRPVDTAIDTLLAGQGVCRDYAHLTITLLRALEIPARLVAVYAPGLSPMDFHAVVEADVDGVWSVVDATRLAPTSSLVRICSGRDAADTAFLSLFGGVAQFRSMTVTATTDGPLPAPDDAPFPLP
jgi:transglutaminase-like putative cysteine protease